MTKSLTKRVPGALISMLVVMVILLMSFTSAFAGVVEPSDSFYVTDEADVISDSTEQYIIEKNADLEDACGGQIVVVTVDFLDGMDIEDYAYKLFNEWEIGDEEENNGILLLLTIGEENYWCMQGKGLENSLTAGDIDDILYYYLEPDFAEGDYDAGVRSVFDQLYSEVTDIYGVGSQSGSNEDYNGYEDEYYYDYSPNTNMFMIWGVVQVVVQIIIIVAILLVIRSVIRGSRRRGGGHYHGHDTYGGGPGPFGGPSHPGHMGHGPGPSGGFSHGSGRSSSSMGAGRSSAGRSSAGRSSGGMGRGGGGSSRGGGAGRRK